MFSLMTYNKNLWAQRGLPAPEPDWSWNDLKAALEQLARKRGDTIEVYGMVGQDLGLLALIEELAAAGVRDDPSGPLRLDDPAVVAALDRVVALAKSGAIYVSPNGHGSDEEFLPLVRAQRAGVFPSGMIDPASAPFAIGMAADGGGVFTSDQRWPRGHVVWLRGLRLQVGLFSISGSLTDPFVSEGGRSLYIREVGRLQLACLRRYQCWPAPRLLRPAAY